MEGGVRPAARLSAQSAVAGRADVPFGESSSSRSTLEHPGEACGAWNGPLQQRGSCGGSVSCFNIPTMPFKAVNFHFRGRSMSVTATLVLLSRSVMVHPPPEKFIYPFKGDISLLFCSFLNYKMWSHAENVIGHIMTMSEHTHTDTRTHVHLQIGKENC